MTRVLHVISSLDSRAGGPPVAMAGLCKAQRAAGIDVSVIATYRAGQGHDLADDLAAVGVDVTRVGPARGPLQSHPDLSRAMDVAVAKADVVHVHALWETVQHQAAISARRAGKPYLVTPHGMLTPWSLRQKALKKRIYLALRLRADLNGAAALHFTSSAERDMVAPLGLKPPALIEPLGVDLEEFRTLPALGSFRAKFPALQGKRIVMFLGRLHPGKGAEYLIPAIAQARLTETMLVLVGPDSGGFRATLEELADRHGVRDQVLFTGMLRGRDRIEALADADLFALPSEHENFGIAVVEALACGVPVVVSEGVALKGEIVAAGVGSSTALATDAIAAELARWLNDDALRRAAAEKARPFVWEKFDWSTVARNWVEHFRRMTGR
ncbi:MAG: hypothetical protein QOE14_2115 [Humisphaera sp.]|nr:hypothetical protein [Humisphaera sp.]